MMDEVLEIFSMAPLDKKASGGWNNVEQVFICISRDIKIIYKGAEPSRVTLTLNDHLYQILQEPALPGKGVLAHDWFVKSMG